MQRNQWSRRKPSTKPEKAGFGDTQPGEATLGETLLEDTHPGQALRGEAPPEDADGVPPLRGAAPSDDAGGRRPKRSRAASSPRNSAVDILARREHSVLELREKLLAREFPPDEVEQTLSALIADGLLSEQRFIDSFLASYTRRGHGPLWLRAELQRRGIDAAQLSVALAGQEVDWAFQAQAVREKRFGPNQPADYKDRARQSRFLQYRGFSSEQIRQAFGDEAFGGGEDN